MIIAAAILSAALAYGVPTWMLSEVAWIESRHNPNAVGVNRDGSRDLGLFQLNEKAHPNAPAWCPEASARYAARYLRWLRLETGSWRGALIAYNCGIGRYKAGRIPARSLRYARLILIQDPGVYL